MGEVNESVDGKSAKQISNKEIEISLQSLDEDDLYKVTRILTGQLIKNPDILMMMDDELYKCASDGLSDDDITKFQVMRNNFKKVRRDIINRCINISNNDIKVTRLKAIKICRDILCDDWLLEAFCVIGLGYDRSLRDLLTDIGAGKIYDDLCNDPIYIARRRMYITLRDYLTATVNLYGVIRIDDIEDIIDRYGCFDNVCKYERDNGCYPYTRFFDPHYYDSVMLYMHISHTIQTAVMTYDGYVLHQCYIAEYIDDCQRIGGFNRYLGREMNPEEIRKYGKTRKQPNFVKLYRLANEYPIYRPSKREFEQYANENYAGENLNQIIQTKCSSQIDTLAEWDNVSSDIMCVRIAGQIADIISDRYGHVDDNDEIDDILIGYLDRHGIYADSIDGDFEDFINDLKRNVRMWRLHGHTIKEIEEK